MSKLATRSIKVLRLADRPTSGQNLTVWQMESVPNDIASLTFSIRSSHDSAALGVVIEAHFDPLSLATPAWTAVQAGVTYSASAGLTTYEIQRIGVGMRVRFVNSANLPTTWEGEIRGHYQRKQFAGPTGPTGATGAVALRTSVLTSGTTLAKAAGATSARIRGWAGGGGGGGATTGSSPAITASAGGGGAGGNFEFYTSTIPATWTYAIGAAGAAGAAGATAGDGGTGGNTTISNGVTTVTAFGGQPGTGSTGPSNLPSPGGARTGLSTNGTVNGSGAPGSPGVRVLTASDGDGGFGGAGGSTSVGAGGSTVGNQSAGSAAAGFGAGGGGATARTGSQQLAGGAGAAGLIILEEFG